MMMFPKPTYPKQKKSKNNKRLVDYHRCECCGRVTFCETHEVLGGPFRQLCIKYGLQHKLCHDCHEKFTNEKPEIQALQLQWRQDAQIEITEKYGAEFWKEKFVYNFL